jgi:L-asparagine transporter-like permease
MKKTLTKLRVIAIILSLCIVILNMFFDENGYKEILNGIVFFLLFFVIFIEYYRR